MRRTMCGLCGEPSKFKMATCYWHWSWPSGDQRSFKQFFDAECFSAIVKDIDNMDEEDQEICAGCGKTLEDLSVYVWVTYYVPGYERNDGAIAYHEACLMAHEERFLKHAVRLADRQRGSGGPPAPTKANPWSSWGAQGIDPK